MRFAPHRPTFGLGLCCWLAAGGVGPAHAADAAGPLATRGTKAFRAGDYAHALADFEEAVTLVERGEGSESLLPVLRFNLARCLESLGRPREAIAAFERYLETPDSETARARATERIAELERKHFARLLVECRPAEAVLQVNGVSAGPCGTPLSRLDPGVVEVVALRPDDLRAASTYTLIAGVETRATLSFGGRIRVEAPPGDALQVRIDDTPVPGPPYVLDLDAGSHRVDVTLPDGRPWRREVRLARGATQRLEPLGADAAATPGTPAESGLRPWPFVAFGGAALAAGLGTWFWVEALDNVDAMNRAVEIHDGSSDPALRAEARVTARNAQADAENQRIAAYALVGGAVALAAVGTYLVWPRAEAPVGRVAAGPGGVVWSGAW